MDRQLRFSKQAIDALAVSQKRARYSDDRTEGLIVDVMPSGRKVFRVCKRMEGEVVTVTLGAFSNETTQIEAVRRRARDVIRKIDAGINPNFEKKARAAAAVTLDQAFTDYLDSRGDRLRESTQRGYEHVRDCYLEDWKRKPLRSITEGMVRARHHDIKSKAQADLTMRVLRAVFNFARHEYLGLDGKPILAENPVGILSHQRRWHQLPRKQRRITRTQFKPWFDALDQLREEGSEFVQSTCDFVETALLTGARKTELLTLAWDQVNLLERSFYFSETKNGDPLELPISDHLLTIFERRLKARTDSPFVFNAPNDHGRVVEPKKVVYELRKISEIEFSLHDLRRTFTSVAETLNFGGTYTLKRLLNHRPRKDDTTQGYTILTAEELREPAQRIENAILEHAGRRKPQPGLESQLEQLVSQLSDDQKRRLVFELSEQTQGSPSLEQK